MPKIKYIEHDGTEHDVDAELGISVMQTALNNCLLYTSPSPRDKRQSRMPSSA